MMVKNDASSSLPNLKDEVQNRQPTSLYIHIPFCASRCFYCDFATYVAPKTAIDEYVESLKKDLDFVASQVTVPLQTVFFGGGTPTLLDVPQLGQVLAHLRRRIPIAPGAEITMEANPGTVDAKKLRLLKAYGVNRLSFGAQTFNDRLLMTIGRSHDAATVVKSIHLAKEAGFTRINLDLMFGLPDQSMKDVDDALTKALGLGVEHISAYWLKIEPGTPFAKWFAEGILPLPGEDVEADMYQLIHDVLTSAGFNHYEISNFAKPEGEALHNLVYWHNEPYFAAGVGAHGYVRGTRFANVRSLQKYRDLLRQGVRPLANESQVDVLEACEDTMILGLRLREGVNRKRFLERHGISMEEVYGESIDKLCRQGLLETQDDVIRLADSARPIANIVFSEFLH